MNLLFVSRTLPSLGGLETMARLIAMEWQSVPGLNVRLLTDVEGGEIDGVTIPVMRRPRLVAMIKAYLWADVVFFNHCYIRLSLPLLWLRRPYVVSMSGMIPVGSGIIGRLKTLYLRRFLRKADRNIVACEAMRRENKVEAEVIVNPFDSKHYRVTVAPEDRPYDFIFAGRVHKIKGVIDMVHALAQLRDKYDLRPTISVAGDGAHRELMLETADKLGLRNQIRYLGILHGPDLAKEMNLHRCILVPSNYVEPIGICCLEGIACGCVAIGSSGGGLGESVGPCGFTFPNGDVALLCERMRQVLQLSLAEWQAISDKRHEHLQQYEPKTVTDRYLAVCRSVIPF